MSEWLTKYLELERELLQLDAKGREPEADAIRDVMDGVWSKLTDADHRWLEDRRRNRDKASTGA